MDVWDSARAHTGRAVRRGGAERACACVRAGVGTLTVSLAETFQTRAWRHVRAGMFAALGSFGAVPLLHAGFLIPEAAVQRAIKLDVLMGGMYLVRRGAGAHMHAGATGSSPGASTQRAAPCRCALSGATTRSPSPTALSQLLI